MFLDLNRSEKYLILKEACIVFSSIFAHFPSSILFDSRKRRYYRGMLSKYLCRLGSSLRFEVNVIEFKMN